MGLKFIFHCGRVGFHIKIVLGKGKLCDFLRLWDIITIEPGGGGGGGGGECTFHPLPPPTKKPNKLQINFSVFIKVIPALPMVKSC